MTPSVGRRPALKGRKAMFLSGAALAVLVAAGAGVANASTPSGADPSHAMDCSGTTESGKGEVMQVFAGEVLLIRNGKAVRAGQGQSLTVGEGETLEVRKDEAVLMLNNVAWRIEAGGTLQVRERDILATYQDGTHLTTARCVNS